jgi:hypothetical protein
MGNSAKRFALENPPDRPATDDLLVDALLAFANGRDVVICQGENENVSRWSRWRQEPSNEERAALIGLLQRIAQYPGSPLGFAPPGYAGVIELDAPLPAQDFALLVDGDARTWLSHMRASIDFRLILLAQRRVGSLRLYHRFANVAAALTVATLLVAASGDPYVGRFRRCASPKCCAPFYLAKRNPSGGPANRIYCSPTCREQYHNSAARKG